MESGLDFAIAINDLMPVAGNPGDMVSVQVNASAWFPLNNNTVIVAEPGKSYGGLTFRFGPRSKTIITVPLARPALAAGVALAMMEALADFGTVASFGYRTLTEAIYRVWYGMFDRIAATQLASVLLIFAAGLLLLERHDWMTGVIRRSQQT